MNFAAIAFLDTFDLAASLRPRLALFKGDSRRLLTLRGPRKDAGDPDDDLAFVAAKEQARWPEMKAALGHIARLGAPYGGIEFGRIYLEMLMPGAWTPIQREEGGYATRFERAHLPLRTNPAAMILAGTEMTHLLPGTLTVVSRRVPVAALNLGEQPRLHLIVDFKRRDPGPVDGPPALENIGGEA